MSIKHSDVANFSADVLEKSGSVLVDFYAEWCGPCKMLAPILEQLDGECDCDIIKIDVDKNIELAGKYQVASVPTMLIFKNGEIAEKVVGLRSKAELKSKIES